MYSFLFWFQKITVVSPVLNQSEKILPKLTIECQCIDVRIVNPMYTKRLVQTTCQLPQPPEHMFAACHFEKNVKILGFCSKLILENAKHTTILMPCSVSYFNKKIVMPQYWVNSDISHSEVSFESGI